jgi:rod shape-determining protein MreC
MQNLLYFLIRYGFVLLFLFLELLCFNLIIRFNPYQNSIFVRSSNAITGWINDKYTTSVDYFRLARTTEELAAENADLKKKLDLFQERKFHQTSHNQDTIYQQQYTLISAKVINNSIRNLDNYLTIDRGTQDGIRKGMGVISKEGVVGMIIDVNKKYSRIISVLNRNTRISTTVKKSQFFGSLYWEGPNPTRAKLGEIAKHAELTVGDKLATSGYSTIFPENIPVGEITDFRLEDGSNFYDIDVKLDMDLSRLRFVYVVDNLFKGDQIEVETGERDESAN